MKYKLHWFPFAVLAAFLGWITPSWGQEAKTAYGMIDADAGGGKGIYTFDVSEDTLTNIKIAHPINVDHIMGAYKIGDIYYYIDYEQNWEGHKSHGFYSFDMETNSIKKIGDYKDQQQGPAASHFAWDAQSQTLFALNDVRSGEGLVKINLTNGDLIPVCNFTLDHVTESAKGLDEHYQRTMVAIAINYDGEMYGVSYSGALYKINPVTGYCNLIGELSHNQDKAYIYGGNCLFFDNETDKLYFRSYTYSAYEFGEINTQTGELRHIATLPYELGADYTVLKSSAFDGIVIPYVPAEASAPQKVQNLTLNRGDKGALTATLEWDNPAKTYGRGGTLEDLDSIIIYRNGKEIHRIESPKIGGHETWTDHLSERGYYTYKFVPVNDMGHGDRTSISTYVGIGDPMGVTNIKVESEGNGAKISWTAPTEGKFNTWIDTNDLTYDVWRMQGNIKVADQIQATSLTDNTIAKMGKYHYNVIAYAGGYQSDSVSSANTIAGPPYQAPDTLLAD